MNPCFAIIDTNTLESIALKDMLWELFNQVEIHSYSNMELFIRDSNRHFIHFFVSSDILFSNSDEFETLKHMTTVLTKGHDRNIEESGYMTLDISEDEESIVTKLKHLENKSLQGKVSNEKETGPTLSSREKEVLRLIIKGLINKEIAEQLGISLPTVIFHRNNICEKLQTRSVGKLTIFAVLSGIINPREI